MSKEVNQIINELGYKQENKEELTQEDLLYLLRSVINYHGLFSHHLNSYENFIDYGLNEILTSVFNLNGETYINENSPAIGNIDNPIKTVMYKILFSNPRMEKPMTVDENTLVKKIPTFPSQANSMGRNYSGDCFMDVEIIFTPIYKSGITGNPYSKKVTNIKFCEMPVMIGSNQCNTYKINSEALLKMGEDPYGINGQFIAGKGGSNWIISATENTSANQPRRFRNLGHEDQLAREEFLSRPGDSFLNSAEIVIICQNFGQISLIMKSPKEWKEIKFPFYLFFRLFGITTDEEIFNMIVTHYDQNIKKNLAEPIINAFFAPYKDMKIGNSLELLNKRKIDDIIKFIGQLIPAYEGYNQNDINDMNVLRKKIYDVLDKHILPHISTLPHVNDRKKKAKFLAYLINQSLLTLNEYVPETNRDSFTDKDIKCVGGYLGQVFKSTFNLYVAHDINKKVVEHLEKTPYDKISIENIIQQTFKGNHLTEALQSAITAGSKDHISDRKGLTVKARGNSKQAHSKNLLNTFVHMNGIETPNSNASKTSDRSIKIREFPVTATGFIDPIITVEGESVGLNRQTTCTTTICNAVKSSIIREILSNDKEIKDWMSTPNEIVERDKLALVFVNGYPMGYVEKPYNFRKKYVNIRRKGMIHPHVGIIWDVSLNEIHFRCQTGRLVKPYIIIDSEIDYMKGTKNSKLRITKEDIQNLAKNKITITTLLNNGIIEYLTPGELINCVICENFGVFENTKNDPLKEYTHLEIPLSIFSFASLSIPLLNTNQTTRVTFAANQLKQATGIFAPNYWNIMVKEGCLQYIVEPALVKSVIDDIINPPIGMNVYMAIMPLGGANQDDSIIYSQSAQDVGIFRISHYNFVEVIVESDQQLGDPSNYNTIGQTAFADYSKLHKGLIKEGTIVKKNDVLICRLETIKNSTSQMQFKELCTIYHHEEEGIITSVITGNKTDGETFVRVGFRAIRDFVKGDKCSSRAGQKGTAGKVEALENLPFDPKNGLTPDIIFNEHGIPSRMTIGQIIEGGLSEIGLYIGSSIQNDLVNAINLEQVLEILQRIGFTKSGSRYLRNGLTGELMLAEIFLFPIYYRRLMKFVKDIYTKIEQGATNAITRQPLEGRKVDGGLRLGYMEHDALGARGTMSLMANMTRNNSDGYTRFYDSVSGLPLCVNESLGLYIQNYNPNMQNSIHPVSFNSAFACNIFDEECRTSGVEIVKKFENPKIFDLIPIEEESTISEEDIDKQSKNKKKENKNKNNEKEEEKDEEKDEEKEDEKDDSDFNSDILSDENLESENNSEIEEEVEETEEETDLDIDLDEEKDDEEILEDTLEKANKLQEDDLDLILEEDNVEEIEEKDDNKDEDDEDEHD